MVRNVYVEGADLCKRLAKEFKSDDVEAVGFAFAYVSVYGITKALEIVRDEAAIECRLIAGIDDCITHPEALLRAKEVGWHVRVAMGRKGIFHPKIVVGGSGFDIDGAIDIPRIAYVGSANLTRGGLSVNTECGVVTSDGASAENVADAFKNFWDESLDLDEEFLEEYAKAFAERNRGRAAEDMAALGISDFEHLEEGTVTEVRRRTTPRSSQTAIKPRHAQIAWAGLQSFTGEYTFQLEFPRSAGEVLMNLVGGGEEGAVVDVECEDGQIRPMRYRFYLDNSMFRLNIPNDTPLVDWARENKEGIAAVSVGTEPGAPLRFRIIPPGTEHDALLSKSVALGTWGKTPTRLYGWL